MSCWNYIFALAIHFNGYYFLVFQTPIFYYRFTDRSIWQRQDKRQLAVHVYYKPKTQKRFFKPERMYLTEMIYRNGTCYWSVIFHHALSPLLLLFFKLKFPLNQSHVWISFLILRPFWLLCKFGAESVPPPGKRKVEIQSALLRGDSRTYLLLGRSSKTEFWHATFPIQRQVQDGYKNEIVVWSHNEHFCKSVVWEQVTSLNINNQGQVRHASHFKPASVPIQASISEGSVLELSFRVTTPSLKSSPKSLLPPLTWVADM